MDQHSEYQPYIDSIVQRDNRLGEDDQNGASNADRAEATTSPNHSLSQLT